MLVHHVANADSGDDFEEVGGQASVEPSRALVLQDLLEESRHCHLLAAACRSLGLHAGADQSQRVTGELTTGAGHGAASQQDEHAGVCAVAAVLLQVAVLQCLRGESMR